MRTFDSKKKIMKRTLTSPIDLGLAFGFDFGKMMGVTICLSYILVFQRFESPKNKPSIQIVENVV